MIKNMNEKQEMLNRYLVKIAEKLDISETMREKAEHSYESVGLWLQDCEQCKKNKIMPQGSFYLGTVIRPVTDNDEYDIDLICLLEETKNLSACEIKNIVGDRLKEHGSYKNMLKPEGKRCWTLEYELARSAVAKKLALAIELANAEKSNIDLTHEDIDSLKKHLYKKYDHILNPSEAYEIFKPLNDNKISKAITAHHLAEIIDSEDKKAFEEDDFLKYIVSAIKYVTND